MSKYLQGASLDSDPREYEKAESFWKELWEKLLGPEPIHDDWHTPWFQTTFADGTPFRDGNPIFSAYSPTLKRGVRVIQHEPTSEACEIAHWYDFVEGENGAETIGELVIACALSEEAVDRAHELMRPWVLDPAGNVRAEIDTITHAPTVIPPANLTSRP